MTQRFLRSFLQACKQSAFIFIGIISISCSDDCKESYFASAHDQYHSKTQAYYNNEGLLSNLFYPVASESVEEQYVYDQNNKLIQINGYTRPTYKYDFKYDAQARVIAVLINEEDSIAVEYDESSRVSKQMFYRYTDNGRELRYRSIFEYPDEVTQKIIDYDNLVSDDPTYKNTYTFDGKNKPYPDVYYLGRLILLKGIPSGNVLKHVGYSVSEETVVEENTYDYSFNDEGYPIQMRDESGTALWSYQYACEAPKQ